MKVKLFVLLMCFAVIFSAVTVNAEKNEDATYFIQKITSGSYTIEENDMRMEGFYTRGPPGAPELPQKVYDITLPPDADLKTVQLEILSSNTWIIAGEYDIGPGPLIATESEGTISYGGRNIQYGKDIDIYGKNEFYPSAPVMILRTYQMRDIKAVRVQFAPVQYNPISKKLQLIGEVTIKISWNKGTSIEITAPPVNWSGYAIVTTNAVVSGSSSLSNFITHLQNKGFTVTTVTETQYGTATGQQRAINIRDWLAANYVSSEIQYVLLIGDPNSSSGSVPMMMCWPSPGSAADKTPTDYFYADLTGNWDSDSDNMYGEYGQDSVDLGPEVYVGRVPVYGADYTMLDNILNKFINYNGANKSIMLPMAISNYTNEDWKGYSRTDGLDLPQHVITNIADPNGYTNYVMYETAGIDPVPETAYGYNAPITKSNVISEWAKDYGIVFWWGHGNQTLASRKYWNSDDGDGVPEGFEMVWMDFLSSSDVVTDTETFTYQCSCVNGYPESSDNLGYALLKQGAVCTVSASRVSWYAIGTWSNWNYVDNTGIGYTYVYHLVNNEESSGKALYDGKNSLTNPWGWEGWQNLFGFSLYGDPSLALQGPTILDPKISNIIISPDPCYSDPVVECTAESTTSTITAAECYLNLTGPPIPLNPKDGLFDSNTEDVNGTVPINDIYDGGQTLSIRAFTVEWGPYFDKTFTVDGIKNVQAVVDTNSTTITWNTDFSSNSIVKYGDIGSMIEVSDPNLVLAHSITLTDLEPKTYYFEIESIGSVTRKDNNNGNYFSFAIEKTMEIQLKTGWNMMGWPLKDQDVDIAVSTLTDPDFNSWIYRFDPVTQSYQWHDCEGEQQFQNFETGRGYWIYAYYDVIWEIS